MPALLDPQSADSSRQICLRAAGIIGLVCTALSLAVFGPDNLVIPAMVLLLAVLLGGRKKLCR